MEANSIEDMEQCTTPNETLYADISKLAKNSLLPRLPFIPEDKDYLEYRSFLSNSTKDFPVNTQQRISNLRRILHLLKSIPNPTENEEVHNAEIILERNGECFSQIILVLGEQRDRSREWSSPEGAQLVIEIIQTVYDILKLEQRDDLEDIFLYDLKNNRTTLFDRCLKAMKGKLKSEEWKYFPAAKDAFSWILKQVKYPYLSHFVDDALPPSLLMTDDFDSKNILIGLQCLIHCTENINRAEIQRNKWSLVIYDAVQKLINERDIEVINKLCPALLLSLKLVEQEPYENCEKFTKYDETLKKILFTMEFSSELNQRKAWLPHLVTMIETMGHATLHWVDKINSVLLSYTTSSDPELWLRILLVVEICIKNTWSKPSCSIWVEIIFKIIFNHAVLCDRTIRTIDANSVDKSTAELKLHLKIDECINLMKHCDDYELTQLEIVEILHCNKNTNCLEPKFIEALQQYDFCK